MLDYVLRYCPVTRAIRGRPAGPASCLTSPSCLCRTSGWRAACGEGCFLQSRADLPGASRAGLMSPPSKGQVCVCAARAPPREAACGPALCPQALPPRRLWQGQAEGCPLASPPAVQKPDHSYWPEVWVFPSNLQNRGRLLCKQGTHGALPKSGPQPLPGNDPPSGVGNEGHQPSSLARNPVLPAEVSGSHQTERPSVSQKS